MATDGRPCPDRASHIESRAFRREVMTMEGPRSTRASPLHIDRASEATRLQRQLMAAAYERVCPVIRQALAEKALPRVIELEQESLTSRRCATGGCA
jgi:hypothetical protein